MRKRLRERQPITARLRRISLKPRLSSNITVNMEELGGRDVNNNHINSIIIDSHYYKVFLSSSLLGLYEKFNSLKLLFFITFLMSNDYLIINQS